jgi:hypothetical protein
MFRVSTGAGYEWSVPGDTPILRTDGTRVGYVTTAAAGAALHSHASRIHAYTHTLLHRPRFPHTIAYDIPIPSYATTTDAAPAGGGTLARGFVSDLEHTSDGDEELHLVAYGRTWPVDHRE